MKKALSIFLALTMCLPLLACTQASTTPTLNPPPGYSEEYSTIYPDSAGKGIYKTREYEGNRWFGRLSVRTWSNPVEENVSTGDIWNPNYLYPIKTNGREMNFQTFQRGQDQLAIIDATSVSCLPILEMDYTIPYKFGVYDGTIHYRNQIGYMVGGFDEDIEEINGEAPSKYLNRLSSRFNVFRAKFGESFTFSYYSGTDYVSDTVVADWYYYITEGTNKRISLPVTKTTDGYFLVDCSQLEPGYYWFGFGGDETIIEIK